MKNRNLSKQYAASLLSAWDSADSRRICSAAAQTEETPTASAHGSSPADPNPDATLEHERLEMVREAAALLRRRTLGEANADDVAAALRLLSHIAASVTEAPLRARRASGQR